RGALRALRARQRAPRGRDRLLRDPRALQDRDRPRGRVRALRAGGRRQPEDGRLRRRRPRHAAQRRGAGPHDAASAMKRTPAELFDLTGRVAHVGSGTEEVCDEVLAGNRRGPFRLTALVGTRMAAGAGGSIIDVRSVGAIRPYGDIVPYAAAKAGLNAMTVAFAHAFGPKVRVNCIMPGTFLTDITRGWNLEEFAAKHAVRFALRRAGDPSEIVGAAVYLARAAASYTTGSILKLDGGVP